MARSKHSSMSGPGLYPRTLAVSGNKSSHCAILVAEQCLVGHVFSLI